MKIKVAVLFVLLISQCIVALSSPISIKSMDLYDKARHRNIPILVYTDKDSDKRLPLVIINHGFTIKNSEYSFIANNLAAKGYTVISIQQDLPTDPALPITGNVSQDRKPLWERGVQNILFVLHDIDNIAPAIIPKKIILIGHSNGGDISMLFATEHPELVQDVISLDSLRMPFPKNQSISILSLRSNDKQAEPGVLPDKSEQQKFKIKILVLSNAKHIDLSDRGSDAVKQEVIAAINQFLGI